MSKKTENLPTFKEDEYKIAQVVFQEKQVYVEKRSNGKPAGRLWLPYDNWIPTVQDLRKAGWIICYADVF
jgi:hypothetical protein